MALDNLLVQLGINTKAYDSGLDKAGKLAGSFSLSLKAKLGAAFGTAAIVGYVKQLSEVVGRWKDISEQTGLSTADVQGLEEIAKRSGLSIDDVTGALAKLNQARREALDGNEKLVMGFNKMGVSLKELDLARPAIDILKQIGVSASVLGIDSEKAGIMMDLLGKQGKRFQTFVKEINSTPINLVSEESIERIDQMNKNLEKIKATALAITATAFGKLLGGDFSDVKAVFKKVFSFEGGVPLNVAQFVHKTGRALSDVTFPGADRVSTGGLPLPTSAAANASRSKNDLEAIRIMKETKDETKKAREVLERISKTGALGSF